MKRKSHNHYERRAYQRASISTIENARSFAKNAHRYGHPPKYYEEKYNATDNPLYKDFAEFLNKKSLTGKRIKVYKQWIFVFNTSNNNPTTVYPIPDEFLDLAEIITLDTTVTFKFFLQDAYKIKTTHTKTSLQDIKRLFYQVATNHSLSGPFCLKADGTIEKDFGLVGLWRVEKD